MKDKPPESKDFKDEGPLDVDLMEKFTRQLRILSRHALEGETDVDEAFKETIDEVQETADQILMHFHRIKDNIREEMDESIGPLAEEIVQSAIDDTLEMKQILPSKGELPHSVFEGPWEEQIARWVRMYSDWKDEQNIGQQVMQKLAKKIDDLIEKDLQFIEKYQKHTLEPLADNPTALQNLRDRIQYTLDEPIRKLKSLKKQPKILSLKDVGKWSRSIHKKRSSVMDSALQKIEGFLEEEQPFPHSNTDEELETEILNEVAFLEKEIEHLVVLSSQIKGQNEAEQAFISERALELIDYLEELKEQAKEIPQAQDAIKQLERTLQKIY